MSATWNDIRHDASCCFDALGERRHVQKYEIINMRSSFSAEDACLNCSPICYGFIGIHTLERILSIEVLRDQLLYLGNSSGSSNQNYFVYVRRTYFCILQHLLYWNYCLLEQIIVQFFKFGTC
mmetsp:Transcript_21541/g.45290  ORF Transcript_21541/g.45290 Transcript_21541/m.45290 type:complete len:123 (-) Transcript_21541:963-1331(-)